MGALARAVSVLRVLANAGPHGAALTEITQRVDLPHPSVHRLLQQLVALRLAHRADNRRYILGVLTFELGLAAAQSFDIQTRCGPVVDQVAKETGHTTYLTVRSGNEAVCLDRREGPFPIRVITLQIGSRRPLGVGAGGLSILASLEDHEQARVIESIKAELAHTWSTSEPQLRELITRTREDGYALVHNRVVAGVSAVGLPIRDSLGRAVASISVATVNSQMTATKVRVTSALLQRRAHEIEESIQSVGPPVN